MQSLLRGQLISLFIAGTGIFASLLTEELGGDYPLLLALLSYSLLTSYLFRDGVFSRCYAAYKGLATKYCCTCFHYSYGSVTDTTNTNTGKSMLIDRDDLNSSNGNDTDGAGSNNNDNSFTDGESSDNKEIYYLFYLLVALIDV